VAVPLQIDREAKCRNHDKQHTLTVSLLRLVALASASRGATMSEGATLPPTALVPAALKSSMALLYGVVWTLMGAQSSRNLIRCM
jgi:hypothetical protein